MRIKFKNWEKFNIRHGDIKHPNWFSFSNGFFDDPKIAELNDFEKLILIYCLCEASKANEKGSFFLSEKHLLARCDEESRAPNRAPNRALNRALNRCISKLQSLQIIEQVRVRGAYSTLHYTTLQNTTEQNTLAHSANSHSFNFDEIYKEYPRKLGKHQGIKKLAKEVKTDLDFQALTAAVHNFAKYHRAKGTEEKFIPYFSTFASNWRDWVALEVAKTEIEKFKEKFLLEESHG